MSNGDSLMQEPFIFTTGPLRSIVNEPMPVLVYRSVVPVVYAAPGEVTGCLGTAFCIANLENGQAVFVTANHVISEFKADDFKKPYVLLPSANSKGLQVAGVVPVPIESITCGSPGNDLALFAIDVRTAELEVLQPCPVAINPGLPDVGRRMTAVGFERQAIKNQWFEKHLRVSTGTIDKLHPQGRDRTLVVFPSFRVSALCTPGMSGGPVWNEAGHVIGTVSVGSTTQGDEPPYSYAAAIVGLFELGIDLPNGDGTYRRMHSFEMIEEGLIILRGNGIALWGRGEDGLQAQWPDALS